MQNLFVMSLYRSKILEREALSILLQLTKVIIGDRAKILFFILYNNEIVVCS